MCCVFYSESAVYHAEGVPVSIKARHSGHVGVEALVSACEFLHRTSGLYIMVLI